MPKQKETKMEKELKTAPAKPAPKSTPAQVEKDCWNGRIGTRMSKINQVVINAPKGKTTAEVAAEARETPALAAAQLIWQVSKGNCRRVVTKDAEGKKVTTWFPTPKKSS
jgi:hypothetical protein